MCLKRLKKQQHCCLQSVSANAILNYLTVATSVSASRKISTFARKVYAGRIADGAGSWGGEEERRGGYRRDRDWFVRFPDFRDTRYGPTRDNRPKRTLLEKNETRQSRHSRGHQNCITAIFLHSSASHRRRRRRLTSEPKIPFEPEDTFRPAWSDSDL